MNTAWLAALLEDSFYRQPPPRTTGRERFGSGAARQYWQAAVQEVAEGLARRVEVFTVSIDEVHRHVEHVVNVALEALLQSAVDRARGRRRDEGGRFVSVRPQNVGQRDQARADAPGVYVDGRKIASLGLRVYFRQRDDGAYDLSAGQRWLVNVGSVGQPRDGDPRAAYVVYDMLNNIIELWRISYDYRITQQKILEAGLPNRVAARLAVGR